MFNSIHKYIFRTVDIKRGKCTIAKYSVFNEVLFSFFFIFFFTRLAWSSVKNNSHFNEMFVFMNTFGKKKLLILLFRIDSIKGDNVFFFRVCSRFDFFNFIDLEIYEFIFSSLPKKSALIHTIVV